MTAPSVRRLRQDGATRRTTGRRWRRSVYLPLGWLPVLAACAGAPPQPDRVDPLPEPWTARAFDVEVEAVAPGGASLTGSADTLWAGAEGTRVSLLHPRGRLAGSGHPVLDLSAASASWESGLGTVDLDGDVWLAFGAASLQADAARLDLERGELRAGPRVHARWGPGVR